MVPIGPSIDKLFDLREVKRQLEAQIKLIETEYNELATRLLEKLNAEGSDKGSGRFATASVTRTTVHDAKDWTLVDEFARKKNYMHLYQRRLSEPAVREILAKGIQIPGIVEFTKVTLNVRIISDA